MAEGDIVSRDIIPLFSKYYKRDMISIVIFTKDRDNIFPISKNIRCCTVPRKIRISQNKFCYPTLLCNSQLYIMVVISRIVSDVNCTLCQQMVVFRNFSFSNHHEKWPSSKTTIINSNPSYLNCTLWVAKECWVAKLFWEMRIFLVTVQHQIGKICLLFLEAQKS